jgi:hypothetical protein
LRGEPCPLAATADVIGIEFPDADVADRLHVAHAARHQAAVCALAEVAEAVVRYPTTTRRS